MKTFPTDILDTISVIAALCVGLGLVVWQIFRSETEFKTNKKEPEKS